MLGATEVPTTDRERFALWNINAAGVAARHRFGQLARRSRGMAAGPRRHVAASGALIDTLLGPALLTPGVDAPSRGPRLPAHQTLTPPRLRLLLEFEEMG